MLVVSSIVNKWPNLISSIRITLLPLNIEWTVFIQIDTENKSNY